MTLLRNMNQYKIMKSPIGLVRIEVHQDQVRQIDLYWEKEPSASEIDDGGVLAEIEVVLQNYFFKPAPLQMIPHQPIGTPFQLRVWSALREIPLGEVVTYGELAKTLGSSPRAVGGACRNNPIPLIIPCHRVVSKSGIGGFSGQWGIGERVDVKQWLLHHEGAI